MAGGPRGWATAAVVAVTAAASVAPAAPAAGAPPQARGLAPDVRAAPGVLAQVRRDLERHYLDPTFGGRDLEEAHERALAAVREARGLAHAFEIIDAFLAEVGDSHTFLIPPVWSSQADYGFEARFVADTPFVVAVEPGGPAAGAGLREGDALLMLGPDTVARATFARLRYRIEVLSPRAWMSAHVLGGDGTVRRLEITPTVVDLPDVVPLGGRGPGLPERPLARRRPSRAVEVGGDVGVWRLASFDESEREAVSDAVRRATSWEAMVLDLRGNPGGPIPTLERLLPFLFTEETPVGRLVSRGGEEPWVVRPHPDAYRGPLVVLTDAASASAAEILAGVIQRTRRGVVLGDRTAGSARVGRRWIHRVGEGTFWEYGVSVTTHAFLLPDGTDLEGTGLVPDQVLLPTRADLAAGRDPVLARALEMLGVETDPDRAGRLLRPGEG